MNAFIHTETKTNTIYILEFARAGFKKLNASAMPISPVAPDRRIPLNKVPLRVRRAARAALGA